jgi:hypothetical protein
VAVLVAGLDRPGEPDRPRAVPRRAQLRLKRREVRPRGTFDQPAEQLGRDRDGRRGDRDQLAQVIRRTEQRGRVAVADLHQELQPARIDR